LNAFELSAGVFVRGLTNLKGQLAKAEAHATASLLSATLASPELVTAAPTFSPVDVHRYTLASHVHWAAEGASLAIAHLLGTPRSPAPSEAKSFADLHRHLDATVAALRSASPTGLDAGLARTVTIVNRGGTVTGSGAQFLIAFAIPHFYVHLTAAYAILRNQGVALTMGDFLGDWSVSSRTA